MVLHERVILATQEGRQSFHPSSSQVRGEMDIKERCGGATCPELAPLHLNPGVEGGSRRLKAKGLRATPQCDVEGRPPRMVLQLQCGWHGSPGCWCGEIDQSEPNRLDVECWRGATKVTRPSADPQNLWLRPCQGRHCVDVMR